MSVAFGLKKISADHYTVQRGRCTLFGGGPLVEGSVTPLKNTSGTDNIYCDATYRINEDGTVKAWSFFQEDDASLPHAIGEMALVILRKSGSDYTVVGTAPMDREITSKGVWEFPAEIDVQRNDLVAFWLEDGSDIEVSIQGDLDGGGPIGRILNFNNETLPDDGDNIGAPDVVSGGIMYVVAVRGDIDTDSIETVETVWESSNANDDAYGYRQFSNGIDAWPESGVNSVANLFDNDDTTEANVGIGVSTNNNIYYYMNVGLSTEVVPVIRFILTAPVIPAGGAIRVYYSADTTQANSLAGAQAVTAWTEIVAFDENNDALQIQDAMYHIGREIKWLRVEIVGGTGAITEIGAFEVQLVDNKVTDGELSPHPTSGLKDRFQFTPESFLGAAQLSALITRTVLSSDTDIYCDNGPQEFFDNIVPEGFIYLRKNRPLGSSNLMVRVKVLSVSFADKKITVESAPGEDFQVGDFVDPEVWFFQFSAYDASDVLFAVSNWIGGFSTIPKWVRSHDTFTTDGN